ncbi:DUF4064 domain-containing protein [Vagococcus vulneris]|uniref:DUF4064 domain-containing protein n=1 Tax=Vagococcus vulneris TaxID=1977869 RepID=A0A430A0F0_9ENTE|nr:DUF4064 domain-containing protein [Vagococcus vulneris]RST99797.1 hypothetical protein CBF37_03470 [Vagococcus vulneris]
MKNVRKTEFILTLLAGIFGLISSGLMFAGGKVFSSIMNNPDFASQIEAEMSKEASSVDATAAMNVLGGSMQTLAIIAVIMSIVLIVLSFLLKKNTHTIAYGVSILVFSVIPFFLLTLLWAIPGILGVIAGIMMLVRKPQNTTPTDEFEDF